MRISLSKTEFDRLQKAIENTKHMHQSHTGKHFGNEFVICPYCGHRQRRMLPVQDKPIRCLECSKKFTQEVKQ